MQSLSWNLPYASQRMPVLAANVVATSQPLAAQAGLRMLLAGGNAADAIVATAIALTVVEPVMNGIGSDAFALVWDGTTLHGLNASGHSPAGWTPARFAGRPSMPLVGWDCVTVPGAVSAWSAISQRFGKLSFADLFEPAIVYAERGFLVSPVVARQWENQIERFARQPGFSEAFMPGGRAPRAGETFRLPDQARTLRSIAQSQGEAFYRGELAARIAAASAAQGGAMTQDDLAAHHPEWVVPLAQRYRAIRLHEIPPNGQGITALVTLGILEHFDLASLAPESTDSLHLQIEAMKLAFADVYAYVADPRAMRVRAEDLLDPDYLKQRASRIDRRRAQEFGAGTPPSSGTVYLTAADAAGMMVSYIQSNYAGFGSGVVVPGTGIALQNRGSAFRLDPDHPNCVGPRKRPFHTIIPAFATQGEQALMSFGVMGADMQAQGHVQMIIRTADYGQNPQAAADAPRWKITAEGGVIVEHHMPEAAVSGLAALGHGIRRVERGNMEFGSAQLVRRVDGGYVAASEPRRDGQAVGF
ncbi:MAG: gamma-glutamyltransferase family protein [Burkholderiales bacterium]|nr:gamma-glutamyltransferase family protein [Burkholderiales bacterium]